MSRKELYDEVLENCRTEICEILGEDEIDYDENFFYMGIESVAMTKIVADLEEMYHVEIAYEDFIEHATLNEFAEFMVDLIGKSKENSNYIKEMNFKVDKSTWDQPFALSDLQEAYYVGRIGEEEYNGIPTNGYMEMMCENFDYTKFERVILTLINRHPMLRCYFDYEGMQHIIPHMDFYDIETIDLRNCDKEKAEEEILAVRKAMINERVDITEAPLLVTKVSLLEENKAVIHFYVDALILDGWSYEIFHRELEELYSDETVHLKELGVTFRDYLEFKKEFKKTDKYRKDKEFWMNQIEELPEAAVLPQITDLDKILVKTGGQVECALDIETWRKIETQARKHEVTPFSVLFSSFLMVVSRWNYKQKLLFNIPEFDRPNFHEDIQKILGVCSSFLLFTSDLEGIETFGELAKRTQEEMTKLIQHHGFSGIEISREIYKIRGEHNKALAPLVFGMVPDLPHDEKNLLTVRYQENHTSQVWIDINTTIYDDCIEFNWNYIEGHLDRRMLSDMVNMQKEILYRIAEDDSFWNEKIELELPEYDQKLIDKSNDTKEATDFVPFAELFERNVKQNGEKTYIVTEDGSYSYQEIGVRVQKVVADLQAMGCQKGDNIVIFMPKGLDQIVSVLSVMWLGATYVPIDYDYPISRMLKCSENVTAKIIVTSDEKKELMENPETVYVPNLETVEEKAYIPFVSTDEEDLIAIIHTSGSTGVPKAVMVTQGGLYNSVIFTNKKFNITGEDRCIALTNLSHDMAMYDIFGMIVAGGGMLIPAQQYVTNPEHWIEQMRNCKVTVWNSVPAFATMLTDAMKEEDKSILADVHFMIFGGDYLRCDLVRKLWDCNPEIQIVNCGGPTETTLWNIYHVVSEKDLEAGEIPYGRPIFNTKYYLLNERLEQVPIGVPGMMYCAGVGVTKGYWNDEAATKEKYIQYAKTGERIYKTGDIGKYNADGEIMFLGREDFQVKINGKRIELNGIAAAIQSMDGVKECVVQYFKENKKLVAYYTGEKEIVVEQFQNYLVSELPKYMIPSVFVKMEQIPLNKNGKVARSQLPSYQDLNLQEREEKAEPETDIEKKVVAICREFMGEEVYLNSDFFMAGGDSLIAIRLIARLREEFEVPISLTELYGKTRIIDWCRLITHKVTGNVSTVPEQQNKKERTMDKWIAYGTFEKDDSKINLLCFPHAGSSAMFFSSWNKHFGDKVNILPVQYPGRENRQLEPMYDDIVKLAEDFVEDCKEIFETDFAVFGHCTGSIIGYEILKLVEQKYNKKPIAFFASSNVAPIHSVLQSTKNVSDEEFVEGLSTYGFIDPKLFELEEFSSYYLPIIRHDFDMQEDYKCKEVFQISAPIYVYSGKEDKSVEDYEKVLDWKKMTLGTFGNRIFEGGHFFMEEHMEELSQDIMDKLHQYAKEA